MIPLASAMNTSGAGKLIAEYTVAALGGNPSPYVITAVLFILAVVLTQFMSNTASKALLCPVGIALAAQVGASRGLFSWRFLSHPPVLSQVL